MKLCQICGKELQGKHLNNKKYCSEQCVREAEKRKRINNIADRAGRINKVAHAVYRAYNYRCAVCGWQATEELISVKGKIQYAYGNEIHHIIQIAKGGAETADNLILLCPNHHKQADLNIITEEELRKLTKPLELTEEAIAENKAKCVDAITSLMFG